MNRSVIHLNMEFFKRQSTEKDKEFVYTLARTVYKDLVIKQFGKWDEKWQRDYFEEKWKHSDYQIVEKNGRIYVSLSEQLFDDIFKPDFEKYVKKYARSVKK